MAGLRIAAIAFALVACGGETLTPAPDAAIVEPDAAVVSEACRSAGDCPFGLTCVEGECVPPETEERTDVGCWTDADCEAGFVCAVSTGRCLPDPLFPDPPTTETSTCAEGEMRRCGTKVGACDYGVEHCVEGTWSGACDGEIAPEAERCDGADNDCDYDVDEEFVLGAPCSDGLGECMQSGTSVCNFTGTSTMCSAVAIDPAGRAELCDNLLDDDCDGETDEGFVLGDACSVGVGGCAQSGVTVCSADRLSSMCSQTPGTPGPAELCGNSVDDDCDGQTDEGFEQVGSACSVGRGACARSGSMVCASDQLSLRCSAVAGTPAPSELCGNTIDDDCDGQTDEGYAQVGTACTVGTAPCRATGTYGCSASGTAVECVLPPQVAEQCNGVDDDADTCIDDGFDVGLACSAGVGICVRSGNRVCRADGTGTECGATPGAPSSELCGNGLDDDCDNATDEGFPTLGTSCTSGTGVCQRSGSRVCSANRLSTVCDATPGAPNTNGELCGNTLDDDCDGSIDEGFNVGSACTAGTGVCQRSGSRVCSADRLSTVCGATPGAPNANGELCGNNLDDDCDTFTDEGFPDLGNACTAGTGICQRSGSRVCSTDRLSTVCGATPGAPNANGELCGNNLDDDCDTFTDEGFNVGAGCTIGVGQCARPGSFVCSADRLSTVCGGTPGAPSPEDCDDLDNDCNTVVDNGCDEDDDNYCDASLTILGRPAICPQTTGATTEDCDDGDRDVNPGAAEICNDGFDQNCDGDPNDGCPPCNTAIDADFDGSNQCVDCDETNGSVRPGATERCDGLDNDCDGIFDEGFDADNDNYTTCGTVRPGGGLDPAYIDCADNNPNRYPFACELCAFGAGNTVPCGAANDRGNNVDEDCDGYVDETCSPCDAVDRDGDGLSECDGDCAPANGLVSPQRAEACDGQDTDCNQATTENCGVGDTCNWPGTPTPDVCMGELLCVESLGPSGNGTGNFTCTSFCNFSYLGLGLGDGCTASQTCASRLTPTANLHGCAPSTDFGTLGPGQTCSQDIQCRSGVCLSDQRVAGPPVRYCTDFCGSDAYCSGGTTCQVWGTYTGRCWRTNTTLQTLNFGQACTAAESYRCRGGSGMCVLTSGTNRQCTRPCCSEAGCPAGYNCSLRGNDALSPTGAGYDTVPVCWPDAATGTHDRPSGAACTTNEQCQSEFCDQTLGVCFNVCCNDSDCPQGLSCESVLVTRQSAHQSFARMCTNVTPAGALQRR